MQILCELELIRTVQMDMNMRRHESGNNKLLLHNENDCDFTVSNLSGGFGKQECLQLVWLLFNK